MIMYRNGGDLLLGLPTARGGGGGSLSLACVCFVCVILLVGCWIFFGPCVARGHIVCASASYCSTGTRPICSTLEVESRPDRNSIVRQV